MSVFPALPLAIIAPTGGDQMQMGMVVTMTAMGVDHDDISTRERRAPDLAIKIIQALHPAPHQCAQHDRGVVRESGTEHGWDCENDVARDHALVEHGAPLADTG
jgi:hypothetical protein